MNNLLNQDIENIKYQRYIKYLKERKESNFGVYDNQPDFMDGAEDKTLREIRSELYTGSTGFDQVFWSGCPSEKDDIEFFGYVQHLPTWLLIKCHGDPEKVKEHIRKQLDHFACSIFNCLGIVTDEDYRHVGKEVLRREKKAMSSSGEDR